MKEILKMMNDMELENIYILMEKFIMENFVWGICMVRDLWNGHLE